MFSFSLDVLKPRYSEAVARLKNSLMALFALVVLTHLLPVPPLYSALWRVYRGSYRSFPHKVISLSGEPSPCLQWTDLISFNCASLCRILGIFHFGVQYRSWPWLCFVKRVCLHVGVISILSFCRDQLLIGLPDRSRLIGPIPGSGMDDVSTKVPKSCPWASSSRRPTSSQPSRPSHLSCASRCPRSNEYGRALC